jgi:hypothetical protein
MTIFQMIPDWFQDTWKSLLVVGAGIALFTNLIKDYFTIAKLRIEYRKLRAELEKDVRKDSPPVLSIPVTIRTFETVERLSITRYTAALKAVLLCSLIGGSCVGYVLQKNKIYELGRTFERKRDGLKLLEAENAGLSNQLLYLQLLAQTKASNANTNVRSNAGQQNQSQQRKAPVAPKSNPK